MKLRDDQEELPAQPAPLFLLMTGDYDSSHCAGWVVMHQEIARHQYDPDLWRQAVLTPAIIRWLEAQAAPHGFSPWAVSKKKPKGPGVKAWTASFLAEYGRPPTSRVSSHSELT